MAEAPTPRDQMKALLMEVLTEHDAAKKTDSDKTRTGKEDAGTKSSDEKSSSWLENFFK